MNAQLPQLRQADLLPADPAPAPADTVDLFGVFETLKRRWKPALAVAAGVLGLTALLTETSPELYRATAEVQIDPRGAEVVDLGAVSPGVSGTSAAIDTEVEYLRSRSVALRVVDGLNLEEDPRFVGAYPPADEAARVERAVTAVKNAMSIRRVGETYVLELEARATEPQLAAQLANAYAEQYLSGQGQGRLAATKEANTFLSNRLDVLAAQVREAEAAVEAYRVEAGLLNTNGVTFTEAELGELQAEIATLSRERDQINAELRNVQRARRLAGEGSGDVSAVDAPGMAALRAQRADIRRQIAEASSRYGPDHPVRQRLTEELREVGNAIVREAFRYEQSLEGEAAAAATLVDNAQARLARLRNQLVDNNVASVRLRELEREAEKSSALYEDLLARSKEVREQEQLQTPQARVISEAITPYRPFSPQPVVNYAAGTLAALFLAGLTALIFEVSDRTFWTARQVEERLGVRCLGMVPRRRGRKNRKDGGIGPEAYQDKLSEVAVAIQAGMRDEAGNTIGLVAAEGLPDWPGFFADIVRTLREEGINAVVVDSTGQSKGHTDPAIRYGLGFEALPELPPARAARPGPMPATSRWAPDGTIEHTVTPLGEPAATVVPDLAGFGGAVDDGTVPVVTADLSASKPGSGAAAGLLEPLSDRYDLIMVDCGTMRRGSAARFAAQADGVVLVGRWRKTRQAAFEGALRRLASLKAIPLGIVVIDAKP